MTGGVLQHYQERVDSGVLAADIAQRACAVRLEHLADLLSRQAKQRASLFGRLMRSKDKVPRGLYIHGGVGRGKSMLMDLFFEVVAEPLKRRIHFHAFMAEAHDRIGEARKTINGDPIPVVAAGIAAKARLLCFDELFVTDIADAMVLGRLFRALFGLGVVVVATSNALPSDLYRNGLNRQLFLPFIDEIEDRLDVIELASARDFRLEKLSGHQLYFSPNTAAARAELNLHWKRITGLPKGHHSEVDVKGRTIDVPEAAMGAARFPFGDLCDKPMGPRDYLALARDFHTIFVDDIPVLGPAKRDVARRFITLIDTLYDNHVCLIATAEAEPDALYPTGAGADHFLRTASRLMEMRSDAFLTGRARAERA
ncbi:MAG: cell division protein ZapE [Hyphomicrobiaceae bacterium]